MSEDKLLRGFLNYEFETISFAKITIKVNPKGTAQKRFILITDMFFYVLKNKIFSSSYTLCKSYKLTDIVKINITEENGMLIVFTNGKVNLSEQEHIPQIFTTIALQLSKYYNEKEMPEISVPQSYKNVHDVTSPKYLFVKEFFKLDMGIPPEEFKEFCSFLDSNSDTLRTSQKFLKVGKMLKVMSDVKSITSFIFDEPINSYNLSSLSEYFSNANNINSITFTAPINADIRSVFENPKNTIMKVTFDNVTGPQVNSAIKVVLQKVQPKSLYLINTITNKLSIDGIDRIEYEHPQEIVIDGAFEGIFNQVGSLFTKSKIVRILNCKYQNASQFCDIISKVEEVDINELELNQCNIRPTFDFHELPKSINKLILSYCQVNLEVMKILSKFMNTRDIQIILRKLQFDGVSESDAISIISHQNNSQYLCWENNYVNDYFFDSVLEWPNLKFLSLGNSIQPTTNEVGLASFISQIHVSTLDLTDEKSNMTEHQSRVVLEAVGKNDTIKVLRINGMRAPPAALIVAMSAPSFERLYYDFKGWEAPMMAYFVEAIEEQNIKAKFDYPPQFPEDDPQWLEQKKRRSSFYI